MQLEECTFENTSEFNVGPKIQAKVLSCYDGDTFTIAIMLDKIPYKFTCRLMGCDTPEMKASLTKTQQEKEQQKVQAVTAKLALLKHLTDCILESFTATATNNKELDKHLKNNKKIIELDTFGFDKYGRLLVNYNIGNIMLSDFMITNGYAYAYSGGTKQK
jgi:endonuclease YncB( thermonuclease family)